MNNNYDVTVKLTTVGAAEMAAGIDKAAMSAAKLQTQQERLTQAQTRSQIVATQLEKAHVQLETAQTRQAIAAQRLTDTHQIGTKVTSDYAAQLAGLAVAVGVLWANFKLVLEPGLEFNSFIEKNRLAIAALQLSYGQYVDSMGNVVDETHQWSDALDAAGETQRMLVKQSLQSAASFQDMAQIYQMMSGAMIAGGAKSTQEMVTFAGITADMAAVMGQSYDRAARQMTLALLGVARTTGQLGAMLRSMGVDNATLQSWRDQGIVVEQLTERLHAFLAMQPKLQETWVGITTNMKTAWQLFSGAITAETFTGMKEAMQGILHYIIDFKTGQLQPEIAEFSSALGKALRAGFGVLSDIVTGAFDVVKGSAAGVGTTWKDIMIDMAAGTEFLASITKGAFSRMATDVTSYWMSAKLIFQSLVDAPSIDKIKNTLAEIRKIFADAAAQNYQDYENRSAANRKKFEEIFRGTSPGATTASSDLFRPGKNELDTSARDKAIEDYEGKTQDMWNKANAYTEVGLTQKLALIDAEAKKEIRIADETSDHLIDLGATDAKAWEVFDKRTASIDANRLARRQDAIDAEAKKQQDYADWRVAEEEKLDDELAAVTLDYYDKQQAGIERQTDREWNLLDKRLDAEKLSQAGYDALTDQLQKLYDKQMDLSMLEENSIIGARKRWEEAGKQIVMTTDSMTAGMAAGWLGVMDTMKTTTESVRDAIVGIWSSLSTAFETGFYDILSGKFNSLKDMFKTLWDDILKSFSKMLAQMLERWLFTGEAMGSGQSGGFLNRILGGGATGQTGYAPTYGTGGSLPMGWSSSQVEGGAVQYSGNTIGSSAGLWASSGGVGAVGMGALGGAAVVGGIASASGAPGWNRGALIGGALELAGEVVTAIVLGAELGTVFPIIGTAIGAIVGGIIGVLTAPNTESKFYLNPTGISGITTGGGADVFAPITSQVAGGVLDTYKAAGLTDRSTFATSVAQYIKDYYAKPSTLESGPASTWQIHAGTAEDIAADYKRLMTQIIPTEMMHALFGQAVAGGQDYAGINGGSKFGAGISDQNAPMVKMLTALGFSVDKITEIAGKIDSYADDPQKFLDWLNTLVGVVTGLHTNVERLGMSAAQIGADITSQANLTAQEKLAQTAKDLTQQAKELSLYTGDQQITKAKELNDAVNQYWTDQESAIKNLMDLSVQLHTLIKNTLQSMEDALSITTGTGTQEGQWWNELFGPTTKSQGAPLMSSIYGTTDPTKLPDLVNQAVTLFTNLFNLLNQRLTEILTLQEQNTTLQGQFGQNTADLFRNGPLAGALGTGTTTPDLAYMLAQAQTTSGQTQLDWIAKLQNAAAARYQEELQEIANIKSAVEDLDKSAADFKASMEMDVAKTPEAQSGLLMKRIQTLMGQIGTASSAELPGITGSITSMLQQYWGMTDKSQGAMEFVNSILDKMTADAHKRYEELTSMLLGDNAAIYEMLKTAGGLLHTAEVDTTATINKLETDLMELDTYLHDKFQSSIEAIVAANDPLKKALEDDVPLFTGAGTAVGNLGTAADTTRGKFDTLNDAIDGAISRLGDIGSPVRAIRNNPSLIYSRTGI